MRFIPISILLLTLSTNLSYCQDVKRVDNISWTDEELCQLFNVTGVDINHPLFIPEYFDSSEAYKLAGDSEKILYEAIKKMTEMDVYLPHQAIKKQIESMSPWGDSTYNSLDESDLMTILISDVVVQGQFMAKRNLNYDKCRYFKSTYLFKVEEVLKSNYGLSPGDTIVIKQFKGFGGSCATNGDSTLFDLVYGHRTDSDGPFDVGDVTILGLSNSSYYKQSLIFQKTDLPYEYEDTVCFNFFVVTKDFNSELMTSSTNTLIERIQDIRSWISKNAFD